MSHLVFRGDSKLPGAAESERKDRTRSGARLDVIRIRRADIGSRAGGISVVGFQNPRDKSETMVTEEGEGQRSKCGNARTAVTNPHLPAGGEEAGLGRVML